MHSSEYYTEKALAKLNLTFRVLDKLPSSMHNIESHIAFLPKIYDYLKVKKDYSNSLEIRGEFSKALLKAGGDTLMKRTIENTESLFSTKIKLKIILYKNIPLDAGLGGGSADAAALFRILLKIYNLKIDKQSIIKFLIKIGSDVPACFFSENLFLSGYGNVMKKNKNNNKKVWVLLLKPLLSLSTGKVFSNFLGPFSSSTQLDYNYDNIVMDMKKNKNALQNIAEKKKEFVDFINYLPNRNQIVGPRMTGSGSSVFILFHSIYDALKYKKETLSQNKKIWIRMSYLYL